MTSIRLSVLYSLMWSVLWGSGCDESVNGSLSDHGAHDSDHRSESICASDGGDQDHCVLEDMQVDAALPIRDATTVISDARVDRLDASASQDSELVTDSDGDGVEDASDNCIDTPNFNQIDEDHDGLGDVCDADPNIQNFILNGQVMTLGGSSLDDNYTVRSVITTATGELTDGQFIMTGTLN